MCLYFSLLSLKLFLEEKTPFDPTFAGVSTFLIYFGNTFANYLRETCIPENIQEAKYQGRTVTLNKPMRGDSKKFKVYVNSGKKNADGSIKVKKVNFGAKGMNIKKNNPKRRKAFRARHNCDNPGPKTMARYWSCKKW